MRGCNPLKAWRGRNPSFSALYAYSSKSIPLLLRWYSSDGGSSSRPVAVEEFLDALKGVFPEEQWQSGKSKTIGLAVSGGVDSMALATLFSDAKRIHPNLPAPYAIIADHGYRPESAEEASWVAKTLQEKLQMEATIIKLQWPENYDFARTERFETSARHLRYQALAQGCLSKSGNALLLAHHADDQAETIMMRLIKGRWRAGLQGMRASDPIPENYGVYGAHRSGEPVLSESLPFPYESGGIRILRPLLDFEKDSLIATCEERNIPWAEDKTNQMPTLTDRNAIRHVMRHHKLPAALSTQSLNSLAQRMRERVQKHQDAAEQIFKNTKLELKMQTGSMTVWFPPACAFLSRTIESNRDKAEARNTAALYLARVADLISPRNTPSIGQFSNAIDQIWPQLRLTQDQDTNTSSPDSTTSTAFCVHGLWWRPIPLKTLEPSPKITQQQSQEDPAPWFLQRQPPTSKERQSPTSHIRIPSSDSSSSSEKPNFHLFDNRFWIRLENPDPSKTYTLRFLEQRDVREIRRKSGAALRVGEARTLKMGLKYVIPALFEREAVPRDQRDDGGAAAVLEERFVALPTLAPPRGADDANGLKMTVHYKAIELPGPAALAAAAKRT